MSSHRCFLAFALAIGFALTPVVPAGADGPPGPRGSISGTVTNSMGDPLQGVCVTAFDSDGNPESNTGRTGSNGNYSIVSLEPGDYRLRFGICVPLRADNVAMEFYDDKDSLEDAAPVTVIGSVDTSGIDAELAPGGSISGTITDTNGFRLIGICVHAYNSNGTQVGFAFLGDGEYQVDGLGTGEYRLRFSDCADFNPFTVVPEFYDNQETLAEATPVAVTAGSTTTGIAAQLEAPNRDVTAPDTVIDSGPDGTITTDEATFTFSSPDVDVAIPDRHVSTLHRTCHIDETAIRLYAGDCSVDRAAGAVDNPVLHLVLGCVIRRARGSTEPPPGRRNLNAGPSSPGSGTGGVCHVRFLGG